MSESMSSKARALINKRADDLQRENPGMHRADALSKAMDELPDTVALYRTAIDQEISPAPLERADFRKSEAERQRTEGPLGTIRSEIRKIEAEHPEWEPKQVWAEAERRLPASFGAARTQQ
jgi:hypothetical protein